MTQSNLEQPNTTKTYYYYIEIDSTNNANGYIFGSSNYDVVQQLDTKYGHPKRIHVKCASESNIVEISRFKNQTEGENEND